MAATKEGFLMKQTWSFNRWRRRYFQLKGHKLYYAKDPKRQQEYWRKPSLRSNQERDVWEQPPQPHRPWALPLCDRNRPEAKRYHAKQRDFPHATRREWVVGKAQLACLCLMRENSATGQSKSVREEKNTE
ncbi:uncharacterized protein GBIM_10150 [Gryllus bimaculatus]|nr:uncharacterized protein GBIM_10150 [Gryllus bimaculatus]